MLLLKFLLEFERWKKDRRGKRNQDGKESPKKRSRQKRTLASSTSRMQAVVVVVCAHMVMSWTRRSDVGIVVPKIILLEVVLEMRHPRSSPRRRRLLPKVLKRKQSLPRRLLKSVRRLQKGGKPQMRIP
jgi:hypothetical protein